MPGTRVFDNRVNLEAYRARRRRPLADVLVGDGRQRREQQRRGAPAEPRPAYSMRGPARGERRARSVRETVEGEGEIAGRLKSAGRTLLQATIDDPHESWRDRTRSRAEVGRIRIKDRGHCLGRRVAT